MKNTDKLTAGETLLVMKKRKGFTQKQMAAMFKVSLTTYGRWERDLVANAELECLKWGALEANERCMLYRRRAGYTQERVAKELKCCRWRLNLMEQGLVPCDDLVWYWEQ